MFEGTLQFLLITLALEVTPGPAVLFVLYQSSFGMRYVLSGVAGLLTANIVWITLVGTGLGLVLIGSPNLFNGLRYVGALYLVYLGYKIARYGVGSPQAEVGTKRKSKFKVYRQGMLTSFSNPKALLFFMALFPQFTRVEHFTSDIVFYGALKMLILFVVMTSYGLMGRKFFNRISHSETSKWVFRGLGLAIIVAAYGVAFG